MTSRNRYSWPHLMRAETAAAYVDEKSVNSFRRGVGKVYPPPVHVPNKGDRWLRSQLDAALALLDKDNERDVADLI